MIVLKSRKLRLSEKIELSKQTLSILDSILNYFEIQYRIVGNKVVAACPIHGGDNSSGLNIFLDGQTIVGNWKCWTHECEKEYGNDIISFIRGILSNRDRELSEEETIEWIKEFLKKPNIKPLNEIKELINAGISKPKIKPISKIAFRRDLIIPAKYYLNRGYKAETLNKFDVGLCLNKKNPFYMRIVVPVYDENGYNVIGQVARSQNSECPFCSKYHFPNKPCPANNLEKYWAEKWLNSQGFSKSKTLYNIWNARKYIQDTKTAILVEGQGDVWRMDEAGIYNTVGMFGKDLGYEQSQLLKKINVKNLIIITDNDEAGDKGYINIYKKYKNKYNIYRIELETKDLGDMSINDINSVIKPKIKEIIND
jgi:5S rRNA maturation endonuclease (ribonuclease M5)